MLLKRTVFRNSPEPQSLNEPKSLYQSPWFSSIKRHGHPRLVALPRIARGDPAAGFATEALTAAIAQGEKEAKQRLKDFLEKRGPKVVRG